MSFSNDLSFGGCLPKDCFSLIFSKTTNRMIVKMLKVLQRIGTALLGWGHIVQRASWRLVHTPSVFWDRIYFEVYFLPRRIYYKFCVFLAKNRISSSQRLKQIPSIRKSRSYKVFDCFTFYDGLDLLEIRLHILDKLVDYFVIVEATTTHSGEPKDLYFQNNKERFSPFLYKVRHIVVEDMPRIGNGIDRPALTSYQRNQIMRGLTDCGPDDVIYVSDFDEIPNPNVMPIAHELLRMGLDRVRFYQRFYYYYLNGETEKRWWIVGTVAAKFSTISSSYEGRPDALRPSEISPRDLDCVRLKEGGWHFSYLGGVEAIIRKISSFEISEMDRQEFKSTDHVLAALSQGHDVFGRPNFKINYIDIDDSFPDYVINNQESLQHLIMNKEKMDLMRNASAGAAASS